MVAECCGPSWREMVGTYLIMEFFPSCGLPCLTACGGCGGSRGRFTFSPLIARGDDREVAMLVRRGTGRAQRGA
jgi:hypothetical protein